ncbi:EpsG family protein [Paraburkholderia sp. D15]|uniref:EpsG family protein n=1 Tax=Paraburkholderia sp. D15 TaxID=2880218 RepID=UPI00247978E6|nr:EpsG family protein [Paraburkholderia sp. D15]WGS50618.1 EpsG family protein [Paraburkholderia sp. D15]
MTFYLVIFCALWGIFLVSAVRGETIASLEFVALAIFVVVAGQRFETGNDWLIYRDHYLALQQFGLSGGDNPQFPEFEPLYVLSAWLSGKLFSFQTFLFIVTAFNGLVLFRFARFWGASFAGVAAVYYAWIYLATQMATTRYSLAMSFIFIALMCVLEGRKVLAYLLILLATGFHFFSLAFLPIVFLLHRKLNLRLAIFTLIGGFLCVHLVLAAVGAGALDWMPFSEKIVFYLSQATVPQISMGSLGYIVLNLAFFLWVMTSGGDGDKLELVRWSVFYLIFFQVAAWMLPVLWNRVQIFVVIIQACVLSKYIVERQNLVVIFAGALLSLATLTRSLSDPAFISYVPYQSFWVDKVLMNDARADGEDRFYQAIEENRAR